MTQRKITLALKKINTSKLQGNFTEALIKNYHLNLSLVKYLFSKCSETKSAENKKLRILIEELIEELDINPNCKRIISKNSLKQILPWALKMEVFFKSIKIKEPTNTKLLLNESEHILAILNISAAKISLN
ncbi:MAG: hypothetical protein SFY56_05760 [Bacteroidota bacterium]|nr:hypothetical protein [Bacteroidota bacterium]